RMGHSPRDQAGHVPTGCDLHQAGSGVGRKPLASHRRPHKAPQWAAAETGIYGKFDCGRATVESVARGTAARAINTCWLDSVRRGTLSERGLVIGWPRLSRSLIRRAALGRPPPP